jgi:hypothetical protein
LEARLKNHSNHEAVGTLALGGELLTLTGPLHVSMMKLRLTALLV